MSSLREGVILRVSIGALASLFGGGVSAGLLWAGCDKAPTASAPVERGMPPLAVENTGDAPTALDQPKGQPKGASPAEPSKAPAPRAADGVPGGALPGGHPPLPAAPGAHPEVHPSTTARFQGATPGGQLDERSIVAGTIDVGATLKSKISPGDVIFVVARRYDASGAPGMPLAVKRLVAGKFPLAFSLDNRDAMLAGTQLAGKVVVTARVDKDGDAITKNPGDITGRSEPVEPPQKQVVVALDTLL